MPHYHPAIDTHRTPSDDAERLALVQALHDHPARLVVAVAGGGNAVITDLLDVPGASRTVIEIVVPYDAAAMASFIARPETSIIGVVSAEHAETMARAARDRACSLIPDADPALVYGLAVTAALVSDRPKRGDHRAHIALAGADAVTSSRIDLIKGALDRAGEDRAVADATLAFVADALDLRW